MPFDALIRYRPASRLASIVFAFAGLLVLAGCSVVSINPLYEDVSPKDPDIVSEKSLIGSWTAKDDACLTILKVTLEEDVYDLQSVSEGKGCGDLPEKVQEQARLVKLDTYYFMDISPRPGDVCNRCLALHEIFLATFTKDMLSLTPIDSDGLKAALAAKTTALATLPEDPQMLIPERPTTLTALSRDLKNFCRRFATDKTIFKPESAIVAKRM